MKKDSKEEKSGLIYSLNLATHLGFMIAIPIVVFIALGNFLDGCFNTGPIFILLGLLLALAVSIYEIYKSILPVLDKSEKDGNKKQ